MKKAMSMVLSSLIILTMVGCGSENSNKDTTNKKSTETASIKENKTKILKEEEGTATYDDFLKVSLDDDYDTVVSKIGEPNSLLEQDKKKTYYWNLADGASISIILENEKVINKSQGLLKSQTANVSLEQYDKLEDNMTVDEVSEIMGEGILTSEEIIDNYIRSFYSYINEDNSSVVITYKDGKLYSKSNNNLK